MITMKFGGTSVGDVPRLQEVVSIVKQFLSEQPVVIASAMSGVTNALLDTARKAVERKTGEVHNAVNSLREKHLHIAHELVKDNRRRAALIKEQQALIDELSQPVFGELHDYLNCCRKRRSPSKNRRKSFTP